MRISASTAWARRPHPPTWCCITTAGSGLPSIGVRAGSTSTACGCRRSSSTTVGRSILAIHSTGPGWCSNSAPRRPRHREPRRLHRCGPRRRPLHHQHRGPFNTADRWFAPPPRPPHTDIQIRRWPAQPPPLVTKHRRSTPAEAATTAGRHDSAAGGTPLATASTAARARNHRRHHRPPPRQRTGTTPSGRRKRRTLAATATAAGIGVSVHPASTQAGRGRRAGHRRYAKAVAAAPPSAAA